MTIDAPPTLPLRLTGLSGSYNIQMTRQGWSDEAGLAGGYARRYAGVVGFLKTIWMSSVLFERNPASQAAR